MTNTICSTPSATDNTVMNRRRFFKVMGTGLVVTFTLARSVGRNLSALKDGEDQLSAWIHIGSNGHVTIFTGKAEVGQNIRTSLAQIVAEELDLDIEHITMIMGDTDLTPYDRGTFGSRSIPYMGPQLRKAAASAREHLLDLAASQWNVDRSSLQINNAIVVEKAGSRKIGIGELTKGQRLVHAISDDVEVKPVTSWKIAGTSVRKVNSESFLTGKHKYVSDMKIPGMMQGKILRPPAYGAKLVSANIAKASSMRGVVVVQDRDFIGVAATTLRVALEAINAIEATWDFVKQPSRDEIFSYLKTKVEKGDGREKDESGDASGSFKASAVRVEQTFTVDYIAHVPLEPRAGLAQWDKGKLTVWTGTQRPFGVQEELQEIFNIGKDNIRVIMPDTGSGYGGKHTGEAGIEAARLAKATGKPVKVVWTREEEFTWAYFRPAGIIDVKAGCDDKGKLSAWEFHNFNSGGSGISTPYDVPNKKIQYHPCDSPLRQGSYRGLAATANTFARECVMNDLAEALKLDPLAFRLTNLKSERMKGVLEAVAKKFGWSQYKAESGHGIGIACGEEKGSYVATCAEVSFDAATGRITVTRAAVAFECGAIINPHHLEAQIGGSIIQGLGGALFESINFKDGRILNASLSRYRVPRFSDVPKIDIVTLNRIDIPSVGAGETPILAIAPAIRNAIAAATGTKLYKMPMLSEK